MNTSIQLVLLVVAAICLQQTSGAAILPQQISGNTIAQQIAQELQQAANNAKIGLENAEHSIVLTSGPSATVADTPKVVESISSIEQQIGNSVSGQQIAGELQQAANNAKIGLENAEHSIVLVSDVDSGAAAGASESASSIEQQIINSPFGQQMAGELQQAANNAKIGLQNAEHSIVLVSDSGAAAGASESTSSIEQQIINSPFGQQMAGELQQAANNAQIGLQNAANSVNLANTANIVPSTVNLVPHVIVGGIKIASAGASDIGQVVHSAISAEDHVAAAGAKIAVAGVQTVPAVIQSGIKIATAGVGDLGGVLQTGANGMAHILSGIFCNFLLCKHLTRTQTYAAKDTTQEQQKHLPTECMLPAVSFQYVKRFQCQRTLAGQRSASPDLNMKTTRPMATATPAPAPSTSSSSTSSPSLKSPATSAVPEHRAVWHHRGIKALLVCIIIAVAASASCVTQCNAEYFSSVDSLQTLGGIEQTLVHAFRNYLELQEREFANYRKFIEHVKLQHSVALEDVEDYLGNPINAFTLIKRMVTDWNNLHNLVKDSEVRKEFRKSLDDFQNEVEFPADEELRGAVNGLARLQKVYKLNATDLAFGKLNGVDYGSELSWHDCFEIATNLFDQKDLPLAITWFDLTFDLLEKDEESVTNSEKFKLDILEYMALAHYELGDADLANAHIDAILDVEPEHTAKEIKSYMRLSALRKTHITGDSKQSKWYSNYTRLCQGIQLPEAVHHTLKCKLDTKNNAYFLLAPLKIEELSVEPPVVLYHSILTDHQIENIFDEVDNHMQRSAVKNGTANVVNDVRVSQQTWLDYTSPTMATIKRLVSNISGLDLGNAEKMQVANYGIGGQYEPHYDFFGSTNIDPNWIGDRLTTSMFYLSDVEQGGYTVFPYLNLYLRPVKGALVMWYNLHKSLNADYRMLHAGCPVIKGSKRIGNIWTHSGLQEFVRPCEERSDHYKSQAYH